MYQKYTIFVKLYIYGLTYRLYIRYKHKLRVDVITYVPTPANDPPSATIVLSVYYTVPLQYRIIIVAVPVPGIATSGHQDIRSTAPVRSTSIWWWIPGSPCWRNPRLDLWDGIPPGISSPSRVTAALGRPQKFHRKVPGRSQQESPQMMGVAQRGRLKFLKMSFWRII